jgi:hypothetical protein
MLDPKGARDSPIPNLSLWLSQRPAGPLFLPCPRSLFCTTVATFHTPTRAGTRPASTAPLPLTRSLRLPHLGLALRRSVIPRSRRHSHCIAYLPPIICNTYVARADYEASPKPLSLSPSLPLSFALAPGPVILSRPPPSRAFLRSCPACNMPPRSRSGCAARVWVYIIRAGWGEVGGIGATESE